MNNKNKLYNEIVKGLYFRGDSNPQEYASIYFYFIGLAQFEVLNFKNTPNNKLEILSWIKSNVAKTDSDIRLIYPALEKEISRLPFQTLSTLCAYMSNLELPLNSENLGQVFDAVLETFSDFYPQELFLSQELISSIGLFTPINSNSIFNPYAGIASISKICGTAPCSNYSGQELNPYLWAIASLRFLISSGCYNHNFKLEDCLRSYFNENGASFIVSFPPWTKMNNELVLLIENFLKDKAALKMALILPVGFLQNIGKFRRLRKMLVLEENIIDTVVEFPSGIVLGTGAKFCLMVLNKNRDPEELGSIRFVDASDFEVVKNSSLIKTKRHQKSLDIDRLQLAVQTNDAKYIRQSQLNQINRDVNLNVKRFFLDFDLHKEYIPLSQFLKIKKLISVEKNVDRQRLNGRFLESLGDFKSIEDEDNTHALFADNLRFDSKSFRIASLKIIDSDCLIISKIYSKTPTFFKFFKFQGTPIYASASEFLFFDLRESNAKDWLLNILESDNVATQFKALSNSGIISYRIQTNDFLEIRIPDPNSVNSGNFRYKNSDDHYSKFGKEVHDSKEIHKNPDQKVALLLSENERLKQRLEVLLEKEKYARMDAEFEKNKLLDLLENWQNESKSNFATFKHVLAQRNLRINRFIKNLDWFFNLPELHQINGYKDILLKYEEYFNGEMISQGLKRTLDEAELIKVFMSKSIQPGLNLNEYPLYDINIDNFLAIITEEASGAKTFELTIMVDKNKFADLKEINVTGNKDLFRILFSEIFQNADKYAFEGKSNTQNKVLIDVVYFTDKIQVAILNNGKPFPNNFDKSLFIEKFSPESGSGLGGGKINQIATHFQNPDWELINDKENLFPVGFIFAFPSN